MSVIQIPLKDTEQRGSSELKVIQRLLDTNVHYSDGTKLKLPIVCMNIAWQLQGSFLVQNWGFM